MPMVSVQSRSLPFTSISPSQRYPSTSASCEPTISPSNEMISIMTNNNTNNHNNSMNSMNNNTNNNSNPNLVALTHSASGNSMNYLGLGIPSLQRRQSSNTAQIMDAYALESSLPMLTVTFPFFQNSAMNSSNYSSNAQPSSASSISSSSTSSFISPNPAATASVPSFSVSGSTTQQSPSSINHQSASQDVLGANSNPQQQQQQFYSNYSNEPSSMAGHRNISLSGNIMGLDFTDSRRQNSLDFNSTTLPPTMPLLHHSSSSLSYSNPAFTSFNLPTNFDSAFSPPKVPPMRHVSTGDFFPHSNSFDMGSSSSPSTLSTPVYPPAEIYSQASSGSFGTEMTMTSFPFSQTRSDSLSIQHPYYNAAETSSHDDTEVPPLSPLSTVYSSPPRSALSTPGNGNTSAHHRFPIPNIPGLQNSLSPLGVQRAHKRKRDHEYAEDRGFSKQLHTDKMKDSLHVKSQTSHSSETMQHQKPARQYLDVNGNGSMIPNHQIPITSTGVKVEDRQERRKDSHEASHVKHDKEKAAGRHVSPAVKLPGPEEVDGNIQTTVEHIYYPRPDQPKPHRIRLIRVVNPAENTVNIYAHGADVGSVVERKSNISRLYGRFESPTEKLLMNVPGAHNMNVGQSSNILTEKGLYRFLQTNKMKGNDVYKQWILNELIPRLRDHSITSGSSDSNRKKMTLSSKKSSPSATPRGSSMSSPATRSRAYH